MTSALYPLAVTGAGIYLSRQQDFEFDFVNRLNGVSDDFTDGDPGCLVITSRVTGRWGAVI